eukprot:GSMAST32.ASY1.ANO1.478.1 assembled CDS
MSVEMPVGNMIPPMMPPILPPPRTPATLPGTCSLVEQLDKKVILILQDGRHLVGLLRSFDQFTNFVLEDTYERRYAGRNYADIPLGLYIFRGENVAIVGELDPRKPTDMMRVRFFIHCFFL